MTATVNLHTRFPPSFEDSPWTYALALFSLTLVSAIATATIVGYALEARRRRELDLLVGNAVTQPAGWRLSPVLLHRLIVSGLMTTILLGALPDVLVLMAWGEAAPATMATLFAIDRVCDGLTLVPFLVAFGLILLAGQIVDHRLAVGVAGPVTRPSWRKAWRLVRDKLQMAGLILLIAAGVTYAKSAY